MPTPTVPRPGNLHPVDEGHPESKEETDPDPLPCPDLDLVSLHPGTLLHDGTVAAIELEGIENEKLIRTDRAYANILD